MYCTLVLELTLLFPSLAKGNLSLEFVLTVDKLPVNDTNLGINKCKW